MLYLTLAAVVLGLCSAVTVVKDCGPDDAFIKFTKIDITPMPFNLLSSITVGVDVETKKEIGDGIKMKVNLRKSNLNGGFTWEVCELRYVPESDIEFISHDVPCTNIGLIGNLTNGITGYIGTCDYKGSCDFPFIKSWTTKGNCPPDFAKYGVPCKCPFPPKHFDTSQQGSITVDLNTVSDKMPSWLVEGGYIVKAEMMDSANNDKIVGCLEMKFEIIAKVICTPLMKRLKINACN